MKKLLTAIALSIALPAAAYAADPTPEAKQDCCEKMKAEHKECCCKDMAKKGHGEHGDNGEHAEGDAHAGHQR